MSISQFAFDPPDGWRNHDRFPTYESEEAQVREDMQALHDQVRDYINNTVVAKWNNNKLDQVALLPTSGAGMKYIRRNTSTNVIETSTNGSSWSATANNGHVILDGNGNAAPQRPSLRFMGATTTDEGDVTVVHSLDVISTATETNLTGALVGDGSHIGALAIDTETGYNSPHLITSGAVWMEDKALDAEIKQHVYYLLVQGVTTLPHAITWQTPSTNSPVAELTTSHVLLNCVLSNPDAVWSDLTVKVTSTNSVTIEGELFGETDIQLTFVEPA